MKTKGWAIAVALLCTLLTSMGQIFFKQGSDAFALTMAGTILNTSLVIGMALYGLGALLLIIALKHGELSVLYPLIATSYIWVSLISPHFFPHDTMNPIKWVGIGVIVVGVSMIGIGGKR